MLTKVFNLSTGEEQFFMCDPISAVKSAYAISNGLATQWAIYLGKLDLPILEGKRVVSCGEWTALKVKGEESHEELHGIA